MRKPSKRTGPHVELGESLEEFLAEEDEQEARVKSLEALNRYNALPPARKKPF